MSATKMNIVDFCPFLESQIGRINRDLECKEYLTLAFIQSRTVENIAQISYLLLDNLRKYDVLFHSEDYFLIVLQRTDIMGGLHLDEILKEFLDTDDLTVAIATFPEDGTSEKELLSLLNRVTMDNHNIDIRQYLNC